MRLLLSYAWSPSIDLAAGPAGALVRVAVGSHRYDNIRESVTDKAVHWSMTPFQDPEFSRRQSENIRALVAERTKELPSRDFVEMMRSAIKEDEWMYTP